MEWSGVEWSGGEWSGVEWSGVYIPLSRGLQGSISTLFTRPIRPLMPLKPLVLTPLRVIFPVPARTGRLTLFPGHFGTDMSPRPGPAPAAPPSKPIQTCQIGGKAPYLSSWNGFLRGARPGRGRGAAGGWRYIPPKGSKTGCTEPLLARPPKTPANRI